MGTVTVILGKDGEKDLRKKSGSYSKQRKELCRSFIENTI